MASAPTASAPTAVAPMRARAPGSRASGSAPTRRADARAAPTAATIGHAGIGAGRHWRGDGRPGCATVPRRHMQRRETTSGEMRAIAAIGSASSPRMPPADADHRGPRAAVARATAGCRMAIADPQASRGRPQRGGREGARGVPPRAPGRSAPPARRLGVGTSVPRRCPADTPTPRPYPVRRGIAWARESRARREEEPRMAARNRIARWLWSRPRSPRAPPYALPSYRRGPARDAGRPRGDPASINESGQVAGLSYLLAHRSVRAAVRSGNSVCTPSSMRTA